MSHKAYIGLLAHHEPREARPTSFIPADQADLLVDQLVAEQISQRVIRMFPPSSVFFNLQHPQIDLAVTFPPVVQIGTLPPAELPGIRVQRAKADRIRRILEIPIVRHAWETWRAQMAVA